jgi:hypothetical protein
MPSKSKNLIILVGVLVVLVLVYFFVIKKPTETAGIVPASGVNPITTGVTGETSLTADNFLAELLSIRSIDLDISLFSDPAFATLRDSTIIISKDGTEGRPNPFAPIGSDSAFSVTPPSVTPPVVPSTVPPVVPVIPKTRN